jgi:hypothetical protein
MIQMRKDSELIAEYKAKVAARRELAKKKLKVLKRQDPNVTQVGARVVVNTADLKPFSGFKRSPADRAIEIPEFASYRRAGK